MQELVIKDYENLSLPLFYNNSLIKYLIGFIKFQNMKKLF